ncbi:hypothetical protein BCR35DRAFT_280976 [Leucosporidium creatinivorum]|uniref:PH domain-containing protein n=1 Tax=Leucosporidium creatinivorum TaxID=106004 RepID=A0A1Y2ETX8_9BASI|nr:hypothetical protein BCR35DRAFT_280976 [Leucosporidium creatinivorum]
MKKGKWSKRYLELKDGVVSHSKSEKGKDSLTLCQLASFEVFFVAPHVVEQLKAPKPFVFALKSRLPRAHYENQEEYCFFMSVKTVEERESWIKALIEARNVFARQQGSSSAPNSTNSSPALSSSAAFRPLLTPTSTPPLSRQPTLRPVPAVLAIPSSSPRLDTSALKSPGALTKPDARTWAAMNEEGRQGWLKEAQREAREKGKTLLDFRGEAAEGGRR